MVDARGMVVVEVKKDSRPYYFYMPVGAPYSDGVDAALMIAEDIKALHEAALEQQKKREEEQAQNGEVAPDVPVEEKKKNKKK